MIDSLVYKGPVFTLMDDGSAVTTLVDGRTLRLQKGDEVAIRMPDCVLMVRRAGQKEFVPASEVSEPAPATGEESP